MCSIVKKEVAKAKEKAYEELYEKLDTKEGEKDLYRLARWRDKYGRDVQHVKMIKDADGNILTREDNILERWKEYFEDLMNIENERERRTEDLNQEVPRISREEMRKALRRMKGGLEEAYDRVPREELWYCMKCSGVAEKYAKVVKDMYENNVTAVRCAAGMTEGFEVESTGDCGGSGTEWVEEDGSSDM
ncbi:uncharacterized protein LOC135090455 [Scylla paramamosain]|uniref:uncharacterized protein LOC135090455 n=1 Tax=Scylla paramamosain TaxID=85552 RepID=UPI003082F719